MATSSVITATWVSGATKSVQLNLEGGTNKHYTMQRPDVAGIDKDLQYAAQLQRNADIDREANRIAIVEAVGNAAASFAAARNRNSSNDMPIYVLPEKQKFRCQSAGFGTTECKEY
jgi:hypothetical protein